MPGPSSVDDCGYALELTLKLDGYRSVGLSQLRPLTDASQTVFDPGQVKGDWSSWVAVIIGGYSIHGTTIDRKRRRNRQMRRCRINREGTVRDFAHTGNQIDNLRVSRRRCRV